MTGADLVLMFLIGALAVTLICLADWLEDPRRSLDDEHDCPACRAGRVSSAVRCRR